jgi:hypothetical protein
MRPKLSPASESARASKRVRRAHSASQRRLRLSRRTRPPHRTLPAPAEMVDLVEAWQMSPSACGGLGAAVFQIVRLGLGSAVGPEAAGHPRLLNIRRAALMGTAG